MIPFHAWVKMLKDERKKVPKHEKVIENIHFLIFLPARRKEKEDNWLAGEKWRKWQENANGKNK